MPYLYPLLFFFLVITSLLLIIVNDADYFRDLDNGNPDLYAAIKHSYYIILPKILAIDLYGIKNQ